MVGYISVPDTVSHFWVVPPRDPQNPKFWPSTSEYLENDKSQRYMSIRAWNQLDDSFLKCNLRGGSRPPLTGVHYKHKCVAFLSIFATWSLFQMPLCLQSSWCYIDINFFCWHPPLYLLVSWAWWDWPLTWLTNHRPSVLWHCWLGHVTRKTVSEMTYNVSNGTLNSTIPYTPAVVSLSAQPWRRFKLFECFPVLNVFSVRPIVGASSDSVNS